MITTFRDEPGIYFENTGQLQQVEATWKLVIEIDVRAIDARFLQLEDYHEQTQKLCKDSREDIQPVCQNVMQIAAKDIAKLKLLIERLNTLYQTPKLKRGLINVIGSISKTLFGTMDAEDATLIDEQLKLLQNKQITLQHVTQNQIKILNATIGHIEDLEKTLIYNENLLLNVTNRIEEQLEKTIRRENIDEHLLILNTILTDLTNDVNDIIDFMTHTKNGAILTHLLPIETIITELKEATTLLTSGLHFPFRVQTTNWRIIQKYIVTGAQYIYPSIYIMLRFPIVAYPMYDIIKITPVPILDSANVFTLIKTTYNLIAIDKENHRYLLLNEHDLKECTQDSIRYTCDHNWPTYHVQEDAPCEIQIYVKTSSQTQNCEKRHIITNTTFWITLSEQHSWLYSTPREQEITISCKNQKENKFMIKNTGKITLEPNCKLTTPELTLKTTSQLHPKVIMAHLPTLNISLIKESKNENNLKPSKRLSLKQVIDNPIKLVELSDSLNQINKELEQNEENILQNKYFVYPMGSATIITIILIVIALIICVTKKWKRKNRATPTPA